MITRNSLPTSFEPYDSLTICSNTLQGGGHIVAVGETLPLVIGKGTKPQIWLQAMSAPNSKEFVSIIEASVSKHLAVELIEENGAIVVTIQGSKVLVVYSNSENSAVVSQLDLRPIGLNLYGNENSLTAGGSTLSHNTMIGGPGGVLIGFGE
ncbi:MAG: hypothetical protein V7739_22040 [Motiliproteus sp.]